MNWCHGGRYLFGRNRDGSTTSNRSRNLTPCRSADPACVPRRLCDRLATAVVDPDQFVSIAGGHDVMVDRPRELADALIAAA